MMSGLSYPVAVEELFQLTALGIQPYDISFTTLTLNGDKYICVRELLKVSEDIVIVDVAHPGRCLRFPTKAEAAIVHPRCRIVALRAGTMVQVFNIDLKSRLCHLRMQQPVLFWKWISETMIVLVTQTTVFHWSIEGNHELLQVFERAVTEDVQVVNYLQDSSGKWSALVTISYKDKVVGHVQLYSLETKENQFFEGSVATFADFSAPSQNNQTSTLFCYAAATDSGIRVVVQPLDSTGAVNREKKLSHELPTKVPSRAASLSPLFNSNSLPSHSPSGTSPPDFPVSMQYSERYGFIFLVSKVGQFFLLSLDSMILSNELFFYDCLLPETLFVTSFHSSTSGLLGVSQKGKVFLITINEAAIIPFIAQFGGEEVAFAVANRASIPWSFHSQTADEPAEGDILSLISSNLRQMELQEQHHGGGNSPSMWSQKHLSAKQLLKNSPMSNHNRLSPGPPSPPMTYSPHPHSLNLHSSGSFGLSGSGENLKNSLLSQLQQNSIPYTPPAHAQPGNMPSPIAPYPRSRSPSPAPPRLFTEVSCYQIMKDFSTACVSNNPRYNNGLVALATHSGNIIVFSLVDEKVMCSITPVESPILALSFCPTREWLCAASPRSILIYSIETRELIEQIKLKPTATEGGHLVPPCCAVLQWDFSGSVLYAIFNDKKILRWTF